MPSPEVRDARALVAQRSKMMRLATQDRNRLHRDHLLPPGGDLFTTARHEWWLSLEVSALQRVRIQCDLDSLVFAQTQIALLEDAMKILAVRSSS